MFGAIEIDILAVKSMVTETSFLRRQYNHSPAIPYGLSLAILK